MHEEIRVQINMEKYRNAFRDWAISNNKKLSIEFDKEIGIGAWRKLVIDGRKQLTVKIKDEKKYILATLKYEL